MSIKISHHTDPRNHKRTLTIARKIEDGVVLFGYAINHVPVTGSREIYDRKQGNDVAIGRLEKNPIMAGSIREGESPITIINEAIARRATMDTEPKFEKKGVPFVRMHSILSRR